MTAAQLGPTVIGNNIGHSEKEKNIVGFYSVRTIRIGS
jgi:hypothetical protein